MTLTIEYASLETQYRRVNSEEGAYDAHAGTAVHVAVRVEGGHLDHYLHNHVSHDEVAMNQLRDKIEAKGSINPEHWTFCNRDHNMSDADRAANEIRLMEIERAEG